MAIATVRTDKGEITRQLWNTIITLPARLQAAKDNIDLDRHHLITLRETCLKLVRQDNQIPAGVTDDALAAALNEQNVSTTITAADYRALVTGAQDLLQVIFDNGDNLLTGTFEAVGVNGFRLNQTLNNPIRTAVIAAIDALAAHYA